MATVMLVTPRDGDAALPALAALEHHVTLAPFGLEALDCLHSRPIPPDVVVIDGRDDLAAARRLCRLLSAYPVLLLAPTAALGLIRADWGLADFIVEPVSPAELDVRLHLLSGPATPREDDGPVTVDESAYTATLAGRPLDLTYTEFELLKFLVANPGRVHTREVLLSEVWGYDYFGGTRTVDVHVRRLRAKFGNEHESLIETVRNVGYRYRPPAPRGR